MNEELRRKITALVGEGRLTLAEALALEIGMQTARYQPTFVNTKFGTHGADLIAVMALPLYEGRD